MHSCSLVLPTEPTPAERMSPCVGRDGGRRSHRAGRAAGGCRSDCRDPPPRRNARRGLGAARGGGRARQRDALLVAARSPPAVEQGEARRAHGPRDIVRGRCPGHLRGAADRSPAKRHGHDLFRSRSDRARSARRAQHHRSRCPGRPGIVVGTQRYADPGNGAGLTSWCSTATPSSYKTTPRSCSRAAPSPGCSRTSSLDRWEPRDRGVAGERGRDPVEPGHTTEQCAGRNRRCSARKVGPAKPDDVMLVVADTGLLQCRMEHV